MKKIMFLIVIFLGFNNLLFSQSDEELEHFNYGKELYDKGEFGDATFEFSKAIKINPKNEEYYIYLGFTRFNIDISSSFDGGGEWAEQCFNEALNINPTNAQAIRGRGAARFLRRRYEDAILDLDQAILIYPNDAFSYRFRGFSYHKLKNYNKAIDDYNKALVLNPNDEFTKEKKDVIELILKSKDPSYRRLIDALFKAINESNFRAVNELIMKGADLNCETISEYSDDVFYKSNYTPLYKAFVEKENYLISELLIKNGANVNLYNVKDNNFILLKYLEKIGYEYYKLEKNPIPNRKLSDQDVSQLIDLYLKNSSVITNFKILNILINGISYQEDISVFSKILKKSKINLLSNNGNNILMNNIYTFGNCFKNKNKVDFEILNAILNNGIDLNYKNEKGFTVFDLAINGGYAELYDYLSKYKNTKNKKEPTTNKSPKKGKK